MFRGEHPDLGRTVGRALTLARDLGHPRAGGEHLLLALTTPGGSGPVAGGSGAGGSGLTVGGSVAAVLAEHGATAAAIRAAAGLAGPAGAGAAADRETLAPLGIDVDWLLSAAGAAVLDRPPAREPLLPLGAARARRRCARMSPPLGLDAQAAYEASLRLALARREREHRPEHLALALVALDPGAAWVLKTAGVEPRALLAGLATAFPPPRRNPVLRAERRFGRRARHRDIVRRYERTTGRAATAGPAVAALIAG
jgi:hypothetical protein